MANIEKIVLPDNTEYDVKDASALHYGEQTLNTKTQGNATTVTNTITNIVTVSGLDASGVYMATGQFKYTASANTEHPAVIALRSSTETVWEQRLTHATSGDRYFVINGLLSGTTAISLAGRTGSSSVSATIASGKLSVMRIG